VATVAKPRPASRKDAESPCECSAKLAELTRTVKELRRRLNAISREEGKIRCTDVEVTDGLDRRRVRLYADIDGAEGCGVEVLTGDEKLAMCLHHGNAGSSDFMVSSGGNIGLEIGIAPGSLPRIDVAGEPGGWIEWDGGPNDRNLLSRLVALEKALGVSA
jgi:hypothetical protein